MNVGLGFNPMAFARAINSPAQNAQAQAQAVAQAGGNEFARDTMIKDTNRAAAMKATGAKVSQKKVLDKAGVTKPTAAKKA
jgi:hypothetical protein